MRRFRAREASYSCYCASGGRDSSYLVYFNLGVVLRYDCCVDVLRGYLDCVKMTLMAVLRLGYGRAGFVRPEKFQFLE